MNAKQMLAALLVSYAGVALAGGGAYPTPAIPASDMEVSAEQVAAELEEARRLGQLTVGEEDMRFATASGDSWADKSAEETVVDVFFHDVHYGP